MKSLSIPYGKLRKSPQQNAACFLGSCEAFIDHKKGKDANKKGVSKFPKYMKRMIDIVSGSNKKCPKTNDNLIKIAQEFAKYSDMVFTIFYNLKEFTTEDKKSIIEIIDELMKIDADPNPLSEALAKDGDKLVDKLFTHFKEDGMSVYYDNLLKILANQKELISFFLQLDVLNKMLELATEKNFSLSSESLSLLEGILFSPYEDTQRLIWKFFNENPKAIMDMLIDMFNRENYLANREVMKILHDILLARDKNLAFHNHFVSQKDCLKFTMIFLNNENTGISIEAFHLLLIFLTATPEQRRDKVNDTLNKNWDKMIEFIKEFQQEKDDDENLETQKEIAIKALNEIINQRDNQ